ncbi:MAG: sensor histidine kinase [Sulfitobacter sp.]
MNAPSLRARLIFIILTPLLIISLGAGLWQFRNTAHTAQDIFDRGLLSAALAISRDIAVSDGDALSPQTRRLINDTSGGELFYHVFAPDGVFVTGYSTPPVAPQPGAGDLPEPYYYNARYQGDEVRVLRFTDGATVSGITGNYSITVWQNADVRSSFVRQVVSRSIAVIVLLVISVALVVWFGVAVGLRPLLDLEAAIAKRTPTELEPIQRPVPIEASGLVKTLNTLLDRVSRRISSKDEFIANAAHQLRNPVAGVLALAEAVQNAPSPAAMKSRSNDLVKAAREASRLTNQLLSFERAAGTDIAKGGTQINLCDLLRQAADAYKTPEAGREIAVTLHLPDRPALVMGDPVMLQEAVLNLISNAAIHGGPAVSRIDLSLSVKGTACQIAFEDNGSGIAPEHRLAAISRFGQTNGGEGSGLGLAIAARVMKNHGGALEIADCSAGALILARLPLAPEPAA